MTRSFLAVALAAAACGGASSSAIDSPSPDLAAADDRAALFAADAAHTAAIETLGPVDGLLRFLRGNAVYLAAGVDILQGRPAIRAQLLAENPEAEETSLSRTLLGGDVSADGNFGFTFGWINRVAPEGVTYGSYVAVWERDDGGDFRVTAYYTRSSPRPPPPLRAGFQLLVSGPGAGGVPYDGGVEQHRRSVAAADSAFAALSVEQGYSVAFPAFSAGFLMPFGRSFICLEGEAEIAAAYAGWTPAEVLDWAPAYSGASASGDLAWTAGNAVDTYTLPDGTVQRGYSKYLTLWARTADGSWRFIADGGSPSPAPQL